MTVSGELVWLINQIRNTPRSVERLRLLALGWRTLRGLSTADRIVVARELGFDGAEQIVEQLARRGGVSPALLLRALESFDSADPDRLSALVRGLVDPEQRVGTADRLIEAAADWLEEEAAPSGPAASAELAPGKAGEFEEPGIDGGPPPPPLPTAAEEAPAPAATQEERASTVPAAGVEGTRVGDVALGRREERRDAPELPPPTRELDGPAPTVQRQQAPPERKAAVLAPPEGGSVAARLAAVTRLTSRFRRLAETVEDLDGADALVLNEVVGVFPAGWARRRAIEVLLRAGLPHQLADAIELVATLERPSERMWALSTLAACRDLNAAERERVVRAGGSPMIERRLRLRLSS